MKTCCLLWFQLVVLALLVCARNSAGQPVQPTAPEGFLPGLIARAYLGGDSDAKKHPTPCLAVIQTGKQFNDRYKPLAEAEIRGKAHTNEVFYAAFGYIVVEKETEVKFDVGDNTCFVNDKDFGRKSYTHRFKPGKYPIEITRSWGRGQGDFSVTDAANGSSVLYHTEPMLKRELGRSFKVGSRTAKSMDLEKIAAEKK